MVKKAAMKTAGISMAGFQPRAKPIDGQSPDVGARPGAPDLPREPGKPFTGVGSVMAAITREAEISQELVGVQAKLQEANSKLAELDGAVVVRSMDPKMIRCGRAASAACAAARCKPLVPSHWCAQRHSSGGADSSASPAGSTRSACRTVACK